MSVRQCNKKKKKGYQDPEDTASTTSTGCSVNAPKMIDHGPNSMNISKNPHDIDKELKLLIFEILKCCKSNECAANELKKLNDNLKKLGPQVRNLKIMVRKRKALFLHGAMTKNYLDIVKALELCDLHKNEKTTRIREHIFHDDDFGGLQFIAQICQIYIHGAILLFKYKQYSYAKDIYGFALNIAIQAQNEDLDKEQKAMIKGVKEYAEQALKECNKMIKNNKNTSKKAKGPTLFMIETKTGDLFDAISHQIYGDCNHSNMIRNKCVQYMKSKFDKFSTIVLPDKLGVDIKYFEAYCCNLLESKSQGANAEIIALSEIYQREIEIYHKNKLVINEKPDCLGSNKSPIRLTHTTSNIFHSVIDVTIDNYQCNKNEYIVGKMENNKIDIGSLIKYCQTLKDTYYIEQSIANRLVE